MRSSSAMTMTGGRGEPDEILGGFEEGGTLTQDAPLVRPPQFRGSLAGASRGPDRLSSVSLV
jgi:hypothetical protein